MLTRGHATVIYPETPLTFRMETPLTLDNSQQAFQPASQQDYNARVARPPRSKSRIWAGRGRLRLRPITAAIMHPTATDILTPISYGPSVGFVFGGGRWGYGRRW